MTDWLSACSAVSFDPSASSYAIHPFIPNHSEFVTCLCVCASPRLPVPSPAFSSLLCPFLPSASIPLLSAAHHHHSPFLPVFCVFLSRHYASEGFELPLLVSPRSNPFHLRFFVGFTFKSTYSTVFNSAVTTLAEARKDSP